MGTLFAAASGADQPSAEAPEAIASGMQTCFIVAAMLSMLAVGVTLTSRCDIARSGKPEAA
jgi:hypothetical protein